ncbi:MAG: adenylate/guanylate cyclase domain-containing protein [Parvibaculaceae bacterium]
MYHHHFNASLHEADGRAAEMSGGEPWSSPRITSAVTLFADIVGYTRHCEGLDPEEAFLLLADFYRHTGEAIARHDAAIVDHFGDEVLAVWKGKAPLAVQAFRALRCGFAMLVELERWNAWRAKSNLPMVRAGIGIHAGPVLLGRPHGDERGQASVFGDTVNIASRLERQTRRLGTDIVISEELYRLVAEVAGDTALLDYFPATVSVALSGRARPLTVRPAVFPQWSMKESA